MPAARTVISPPPGIRGTLEIGGPLGMSGGIDHQLIAAVAKTRQPPARPSSPSVKLTAFEEPTMTSTASGMNHQPSEMPQPQRRRQHQPVGQRGVVAGKAATAATTATTSCPASFCAAKGRWPACGA